MVSKHEVIPNTAYMSCGGIVGKQEKEPPGFKAYVNNRLMDKIVKVNNDLVVPTTSPYEKIEKNGSDFFPIDDRYLFSGSESVHHCSYFAQQITRDKILQWLS